MPKKQVQFYDSWVYTILEVLSEHVGTVTEWALKQHHFQMLALGVRSQSISRKKKLSWKHCKMTQFLTLYALSWFLSTKHDKFMTTQQVITFLFDPSLNITMQPWMHITAPWSGYVSWLHTGKLRRQRLWEVYFSIRDYNIISCTRQRRRQLPWSSYNTYPPCWHTNFCEGITIVNIS